MFTEDSNWLCAHRWTIKHILDAWITTKTTEKILTSPNHCVPVANCHVSIVDCYISLAHRCVSIANCYVSLVDCHVFLAEPCFPSQSPHFPSWGPWKTKTFLTQGLCPVTPSWLMCFLSQSPYILNWWRHPWSPPSHYISTAGGSTLDPSRTLILPCFSVEHTGMLSKEGFVQMFVCLGDVRLKHCLC